MFLKTGNFDLAEDEKYHNLIKEQYRELTNYSNATCYYIRKTVSQEFLSYGEYANENLDKSTAIKMTVKGIESMGDDNMFEKFGGLFEDNVIIFYASTLDLDEKEIVPMEEDLIFVPAFNNRIFEITKVDDKSGLKFNHGYGNIGWRMNTKLYTPNMVNSESNTGTIIDSPLNDIKNKLNIKTNEKSDTANINNAIVLPNNNPFRR